VLLSPYAPAARILDGGGFFLEARSGTELAAGKLVLDARGGERHALDLVSLNGPPTAGIDNIRFRDRGRRANGLDS